MFSVKSSFDMLEGGNQCFFPFTMIWNLCVPTKVGFSAREEWWDKVMSMEQLKIKGFCQNK